ncbi:hypothetical protein [Pusillimonas noertemannii]|uniref:Uncharacterized protein n=1 Tax=Pusillimonas noertemannii TaxID=305977 RepID=A0A2U1CRT2_9BURK|nr:hypothetical protein [Pusillimonas noertemannii]NYT67939.1 hypothetical protein [Pusillimonas noertemannii]PVY68610.1 hypothetical protein C7440_1021 [Pusillimonas noertemannii]TFL11919.1 hypothetical protein CSC72_01955 [Pusillimonas noertemannii]
MTTEALLNVDDLAQEIRRVDGKHDLGAGALAEALLPFIEQAVLQSPEVQRLREGWATVPVYPTNEMVRAMFGQPDETGCYHFSGGFGNIAYQFGRLIDAAMEKQP